MSADARKSVSGRYEKKNGAAFGMATGVDPAAVRITYLLVLAYSYW